MIKESPYWWDTAPTFPDHSNRPIPTKVDVVVIGSGYTGLSTARSLAKNGAKVIVLEKETIGWGASSRNGGQVLTGLKVGVGSLIKKFGLERARELYSSSLASIDFTEQLIADEQIDCEYERAGHIDAAFKPQHFDHFKHTAEILERDFNHPVKLVSRSDQHSELGSNYYHGLMIDERSGQVHPAKYVRGLALAVERYGVELHEKTPALRIEKDQSGFKITTPRGSIATHEVVVATNGYTDQSAQKIRRRVFPVGSYIIATEPLRSDVAAKILPNNRVVFDSKNFLYYFRLSSDNRLLFGGRAQFTPSTPNSTHTSAEILRRGMVEVFPELADVQVDYAWSGNVCFTLDKFPRSGRMDGIYYALGYGGHGVAMSTYLGSQLAEVIGGRPGHNPFENFSFPAIPLYEGRPWFLPFGAIYYKVMDMIS
jgi:glycine/D-amino acid oxidase-like deaminating enzyme